VGPETKIGKGTVLHNSVTIQALTTIGEDNQIFQGVIIGAPPQDLKYKGEKSLVVIGSRNHIREYVTIHRASGEGNVTYVGDENLIMAYVHLAHNCVVKNRVSIANTAGLSGYVTIEDSAVVGGMAGIHQFVRIGKMAMVGGFSKITQDISPYMLVDGNPAKLFGVNSKGLMRNHLSKEVRAYIKRGFKLLTSTKSSLQAAIEEMETEFPKLPELEYLIDFLKNPSVKGILRKSSSWK